MLCPGNGKSGELSVEDDRHEAEQSNSRGIKRKCENAATRGVYQLKGQNQRELSDKPIGAKEPQIHWTKMELLCMPAEGNEHRDGDVHGVVQWREIKRENGVMERRYYLKAPQPPPMPDSVGFNCAQVDWHPMMLFRPFREGRRAQALLDAAKQFRYEDEDVTNTWGFPLGLTQFTGVFDADDLMYLEEQCINMARDFTATSLCTIDAGIMSSPTQDEPPLIQRGPAQANNCTGLPDNQNGAAGPTMLAPQDNAIGPSKLAPLFSKYRMAGNFQPANWKHAVRNVHKELPQG